MRENSDCFQNPLTYKLQAYRNQMISLSGLKRFTRFLPITKISLNGRSEATPSKYLKWGRLQKLNQVSPGKCAHKAMPAGSRDLSCLGTAKKFGATQKWLFRYCQTLRLLETKNVCFLESIEYKP